MRTTRSFLIEAIVLPITLAAAYLLTHGIIYETHFWLRTRYDANAVYVIGDSRTYHAVDVTELRHRTGRSFYTFAQPAMSAYSVLKISEMVPPRTTVLFGPSWGMLLRGGKASSFRSGLSLRGASHLLMAGAYDDLRRVFSANRVPVDAPFLRDTPTLEDSATRDLRKLDAVRGFYLAPRPADLELKRSLLREAIRILIEKGCRLEVIDVPIPDDVAAARDATYGSLIEELDELRHPSVHIHEGIRLGDEIWYDADHMNSRGRALMVSFLVDHVFRPEAGRP